MQKNNNLDTTIVNSVTLAQILGITDRRVRQLVEEGVIKAVGRGKYGLIETVQQYCNYLRQKSEVDSNKKGSQLDYESERAKHEKVKREKSELQLKIMRGELHRSEDVELAMTNMIINAKTKLLGIPPKVASMIIGYKDISKAQGIIQKYIEEVLQELSEYDPEMFLNDEVLQRGDVEDD